MDSKLIKYWMVLHEPDTTETGCCMAKTYIKTEWKGFPAQQSCEKEILEDFCYKRFGLQVDYVQGVDPTIAWKVISITEKEYELAEPVLWTSFPPKKLIIEIGYKGQTNIVSGD